MQHDDPKAIPSGPKGKLSEFDVGKVTSASQDTGRKIKDIEDIAPQIAHDPSFDPREFKDHPWLKRILLPDGLFSPQANKVVVRSLKVSRADRIILPESHSRTAGWFIVGIPNKDDMDQIDHQTLTIDGNDDLQTEIGPGDIISCSDFQAWPVDISGKDGIVSRWRLLTSEDVIMIVKQGTKTHNQILHCFEPFCNESDANVDA